MGAKIEKPHGVQRRAPGGFACRRAAAPAARHRREAADSAPAECRREAAPRAAEASARRQAKENKRSPSFKYRLPAEKFRFFFTEFHEYHLWFSNFLPKIFVNTTKSDQIINEIQVTK